MDRATRLLDLDAIATGPAPTTGIGPGFEQHQTLGWTLQGIRDHPGVGSGLLDIALRSPSIQNRNGALNALEAWGPTHWTNNHHRHLRDLATHDPNNKIQTRARELLHEAQRP